MQDDGKSRNRVEEYWEVAVELLSGLTKRVVFNSVAAIALLVTSPQAHATTILHTYSRSLGWEVANLIEVDASRLLPLLPTGYDMTPAAALGVGGPDKGILVINSYQGFAPTVDGGPAAQPIQVAIDIAIAV